MVEIDKRLENVVVKHTQTPLIANITNNQNATFFDNESLKNCVQDSELIYSYNFEENRKRKMRLAKIINDSAKFFPINDTTLNCADEIRTVLVNNPLFDNLSNFSNLKYNEDKLTNALKNCGGSSKKMEGVRNVCYKDLFILRMVWFANQAHSLLTQMPLPQDENKRKELLMEKMLLREYINKNLKEEVETFTNDVNPAWIYNLETSNLRIQNKRQQLTEFASAQLKNMENNILRNGDNKNANSCFDNFENAKNDVVLFFEVIKGCKAKYLQSNYAQSENTLNKR